MMILLFKLLLAHLLGDFLFQPNSWVKAKEKNKLTSWQLYAHILIHFALILILVWNSSFILWAIIIAVIHFATDVLKVFLQSQKSKEIWFFADQFIHISTIVLVAFLSQNIELNFSLLFTEYYLSLAMFVYALTQPASAFIKHIISKWSFMIDTDDSLENAGKYIGMLERLLVFACVISGYWEVIGFLLAAKSVFRFGDLKESKDRKLTEYVLIGTLLSFGIAIVTGIIFYSMFSKKI